MKTHNWEDVRTKRFTKTQREAQDAWVKKKILEMDLKAVRKLSGKKQKEVADALDITQPRLSDIEQSRDHRVSTLKRYVEALGGRLELRAEFDDKSVRLSL